MSNSPTTFETGRGRQFFQPASFGAMPNQLPLSPARVWHMGSAKQSTGGRDDLDRFGKSQDKRTEPRYPAPTAPARPRTALRVDFGRLAVLPIVAGSHYSVKLG